MKIFIFTILLLFAVRIDAQYIAVRAKYTETRLVDDAPNPPKRENRLILSFFEVSPSGVHTPANLVNYDIWIQKEGLQYGNVMGGVLDSTGNNYPGYNFPAPKVVSYYNTLGLNYIDCSPFAATHYVVNGHQLDCGFVTVSYWDMDWGTMVPFEAFPAPNVCLTLYDFTHPYYIMPGNLNFGPTYLGGGPPYNLYNFHCGGPLQLVIRGLMPADSGSITIVLPVRLANVSARIDAGDQVTVSFSNMTETDVLKYEIETSLDGISFQTAGTLLPLHNNGGRADYSFNIIQVSERAYYRIKATETTGTVLYSQVMVVKKDTGSATSVETLSVYPNPVTGDQFTVRLSNARPGRYVCTISNTEGQQLRHSMIAHNNGDLVRQMNMTGLPSGLYRIVLWSSTQKFSTQVFYVH